MQIHARRCRQRGAATIEAILALLVFVLVWVGVLYMGRSSSAKLELKSQARACAWVQSANFCSAHIECSTAVGSGAIEGAEEGVMNHFEDDGELGDFLGEILEQQVSSLFGERATVFASKDLDRPVHLGGEQVSVSASYSLPCNTKPVSADTLAGQLMDLVKEKVF